MLEESWSNPALVISSLWTGWKILMLCLIFQAKLFSNNTPKLLSKLLDLKSCNGVMFPSPVRLLVNSSVAKLTLALFQIILRSSSTSSQLQLLVISMLLPMILTRELWTLDSQLSNTSLINSPVLPLLITTTSSTLNSAWSERSNKSSCKSLRNTPSLEVLTLSTLISAATQMLFLTSKTHAEEFLILNSATLNISTISVLSQNSSMSALINSSLLSADLCHNK